MHHRYQRYQRLLLLHRYQRLLIYLYHLKSYNCYARKYCYSMYILFYTSVLFCTSVQANSTDCRFVQFWKLYSLKVIIVIYFIFCFNGIRGRRNG